MDLRNRQVGEFGLRFWIRGLVALGVVGIVGCAASPGPSPEKGSAESASQAVERRANARWDALVAGDLARAYEYLSPGSRQVYSVENYKALIRPGLWKKARVERVECPEAEICEVVVQVDYAIRGTAVSTPLRETWTQSGAEWWFVMK